MPQFLLLSPATYSIPLSSAGKAAEGPTPASSVAPASYVAPINSVAVEEVMELSRNVGKGRKKGNSDPFRIPFRMIWVREKRRRRRRRRFMVVACADSRVCPSKILGFQPGEAFTVRNVANLVPPYQHGASETSAALEFAVNSLKVPNILIIGHSCCGGIRALMSMKQKSGSKSFIEDWVSIAKSARLSTEATVGNLSFDRQCTHCEKESINGSILNLLTYPWIEEKVTRGSLLLHGGYYDFTDCSFEKWTLVYRENLEGGSKFAIKGCSTWF